MAEETQYTANTGMVTISTANRFLDGTGTTATLIQGASLGTLVKSITIKAQTNTTRGMIRFFMYDGVNTRLFLEVDVFPIIKSASNPAFEAHIPIYCTISSSTRILVSTENAETFNVIAQGLNWGYYSTSVRPDTTQNISSTSSFVVSTANSNLDGTGTLTKIYTAGSPGTYKGSSIRTITIKSTVNVTSGMIRLFIDNTSTKRLYSEIPVNTMTKSAIDESFEYQLVFDDDFDLQADYLLYASTQNAESFCVTTEASDYLYEP